jgi:hypothetical protein
MDEFLASDVAKARKIDNSLPSTLLQQALFTLAGLERVRETLSYPIHILSGYRCVELNQRVGGVSNSQHVKAEAADIVCPKFGPPLRCAKFLYSKRKMLGLDQMILESSWLHLSFTSKPRYQVFTLVDGEYLSGIVYQGGSSNS